MKSAVTRGLGALALACTTLAAQAGVQVTLSNWAYGSGAAVSATGYAGSAGGFAGTLTGADVFSSNSFLTYCIELEEHFGFSLTPMTQYSVKEGSEYFALKGMPGLLAHCRHLVVEFLPHHMSLVAGVTVPEFLATIPPRFVRLSVPSTGQQVGRDDFNAVLSDMMRQGQCDDGIIFSAE